MMKTAIKALIADEHLLSRNQLKALLKNYPYIELIDEVTTGEEALLKAIQLQPDVMFLDAFLPGMSGVETASALSELKRPPLVVFTAAEPDDAAKAFRCKALDYLLKPYEETIVQDAVQRILHSLAVTKQLSARKLAIEQNGEITYIKPRDLLYIYRDENMTKLILKNGRFETKIALKELENRLLPYDFFRIHKSFLVNLDYVEKLTPWFNGAYQLQLYGTAEKLSVSRNYVKELRARLEL